MRALPPEVLAEIQKEYIDGFSEKIAIIKNCLSKKDWNGLAVLVHKIAGSGKTYQMPELSLLSRSLEDRLNHIQQLDDLSAACAHKLIEALESRKKGAELQIEESYYLKVSG
jgi:HPt (histidine-containing phosphotransfer) domain-containing protein